MLQFLAHIFTVLSVKWPSASLMMRIAEATRVASLGLSFAYIDTSCERERERESQNDHLESDIRACCYKLRLASDIHDGSCRMIFTRAVFASQWLARVYTRDSKIALAYSYSFSVCIPRTSCATHNCLYSCNARQANSRSANVSSENGNMWACDLTDYWSIIGIS